MQLEQFGKTFNGFHVVQFGGVCFKVRTVDIWCSFPFFSQPALRTVPTFVTAHTFCASEILGFPIGGAYK